MKILFVSETWLGSCARSIREALSRYPEIEIDELAEDAVIPKVKSRVLRALHRVIRPLYHAEFNQQVLERLRGSPPDFLVTYKGHPVHTDLLRAVSALGVKTVNIYPDCSPHAHGKAHRKAVGEYDLVISTKPFHPGLWREGYGYHNRCVFVPQGYDPLLHLAPSRPTPCLYDVVMIATYRAEYGRLMLDFAKALCDVRLKVVIGGFGWDALKGQLPKEWYLPGTVLGRSYGSLLRSGKICIAPLTGNMQINKHRQSGDVDSTRSYELAAAHCFFIHRRTYYISELYETAGVPMFDDGEELAEHVLHYINAPEERARIAQAAHQTAVPAFSLDKRAEEIYRLLDLELTRQSP
jgi:glycosyltransferase involved in cell wall biosynthesis